jgi:endo-1,4-beta-xylanase
MKEGGMTAPRPLPLTRRAALGGALGLTTAPALAALKPREEEPLIVRAKRVGLYYGAALATRHLGDPDFPDVFAEECGLLVPEYEAKWAQVQPEPGRFNFAPMDRLTAYARERHLLARGHTLLWHRSLPAWLGEAVLPSNAARLIQEHIGPTVARYRNRMHSWDVVNEAIEPKDGRADGLRVTPWLKTMGPRYLDVAFQAARAVDGDVLLVYNEYGLDYATENDEARRIATLKLLESLRGRGVPVGALGIQAHLGADNRPFDANVLRRFLADVAGMGLRIIISELDVADKALPADPATRDKRVAEEVKRYLETVLDERRVIAVLTWGLSDKHSWLNQAEHAKRADGLPVRGLPLDDEFNRKPMWAAMARAFDFAPVR